MKENYTKRYKIINLALFLVVALVVGAILFFIRSGGCVDACSYELKVGLLNPLYSGGKVLAVILALMLFIPAHIFRRWLFFVTPIPFLVTLYWIQDISVYSSGVIQYSRANVAEMMMMALGVITFIFVVGHLLYDRKHSRKEKPTV